MNPVQYQCHPVVMATPAQQPERSIGYTTPLSIAIGVMLVVLGIAAFFLNIVDMSTSNLYSLLFTAGVAGILVSFLSVHNLRYEKILPTHWAQGVVATLNQRQRR